ncbi:MAG TPA: hypothetical protein VMT00_14505 [Thermoanaerobaculia bacterium]|nr:hypothetical protein [Thermoanaerobaculia bacterium]
MRSSFARLRGLLACAGLTLTLACGELKDLPTAPDDEGPPDPSATFTRVQREIFTPTCTLIGCHDAQFPQSELVLVEGQAYANIVNRPSVGANIPRITPGDPSRSYLYLKVTGAPSISGDRMPQGRPPLSEAELDLIRDWIRRGAPND